MVPERPSLEGLEEKWSRRWEEAGLYHFDRRANPERVFAIDTPPPTVSGSLHVGHMFSYTHTDVIARYRRMAGDAVFYPMGFDDNGLPTERRVQNYYGVTCDPSLRYEEGRYEEGFAGEASGGGGKATTAISRPNFVELCHGLTAEDERAFEEVFRRLGLSVDWSITYTTIGERSRRTSQTAFLSLLRRGEAYQAEAPTLWDVDFKTAVAQAELEDREVEGTYHRLRFRLAGDAERAVEIETTRPEMLGACVALVAHPGDDRYRELFGRSALTPLFGVEVPLLAHPLADPSKGTGAAMVCTFGDVTDIVWWRELKLPVRPIMGRDGTLQPLDFAGLGPACSNPAAAEAAYDQLVGKPAGKARRLIAGMLAGTGEMIGDPRPVRHQVKFYERGERPLEIVTSRQWFIRTMDHKQDLLEAGRQLKWHPQFMRQRYESWVEGLSGDWLVSRQRFFGIPFPIWYPIDSEGVVDRDHPILPPADQLPVDPTTDPAPGYEERVRGERGGFAGEVDVMDTWATSSLTPQIAGGWTDDPELFSRVFPMDLRPQAHDIIRTWLFSTVVRSRLEHGTLPWSDVTVSGWILDPDRKKMSKSKGNVVTPLGLLAEHGSDAIRYWAASARLGADTAFQPLQLKVGRRLATKLLNASRFAISRAVAAAPEEGDGAPGGASLVTSPLDRSMLAQLFGVVEEATAAYEAFDHARALEVTEAFFWHYCDDYLELVKARSYGEQGADGGEGAAGTASARQALEVSLEVLLKLFAPVLCFVTEEVWSWWRQGSVHTSAWPSGAELARLSQGANPALLDVASDVLSEVRKAKTAARASMRAPVSLVEVHGGPERLSLVELAAGDIRSAGNVEQLVLAGPGEPGVVVRLGAPAA
ncbi:MAG: valine--tRNA ligase [Acidimicrobiales bacterium]